MSARPNLLILHCHDLGRHLGCYGVPTLRTPHLDRLAAEGVRFDQAHCTAPQCSPARASLFTGRYPAHNGVLGLCHPPFSFDLDPAVPHLGQLLTAAGYTTAGIGIIHETMSGGARCGYQRYDGASRATQVADLAIQRLGEFAAEPGRPFALVAGAFEPHRMPKLWADASQDQGFLGPDLAPDSSLGITVPPWLQDTPTAREELAELQGAILQLDTQVGRILAALAASPAAADTIVLFTTDHGLALPRAKCSLYDPGTSVSLLLHDPARPHWRGRQVAAQVSHLDVLPTLLARCGLDAPPGLPGRDLAAVIEGRDPGHAELCTQMTWHDFYDPIRAIRTPTHKLMLNFSANLSFMDPSQTWHPRCRPVVPANPVRARHPLVELYDLAADPHERSNRADDPALATVRADLLARLAAHLRRTGDVLLQPGPRPPAHQRALDLLP